MEQRRILLVDDHTLFREGLKVLLKQDPSFVVAGEAGTMEEACEKAGTLMPDLVLMDVALPDVNGIDGVHNIMSAVSEAKVVMISMYSRIDYIVKAIRAGAVGYIVKDSTPDMLLRALNTVSEGHYYFDPSVIDEIARYIIEQAGDEAPISDEKYDRLTPREQEILRLVAQGLTSRRIAGKLFISPKTVENHRTRIMEKLELDSMFDLIKYAAKLGIIELGGNEE